MDKIVLRCFIDDHNKPYKQKNTPNYVKPIVLAFDTETSIDKYQNLLYGSCGIWINDRELSYYFFHADDLKEDKIQVIKDYALIKGYTVLTRKEFLEKIFYPFVYSDRAICIGFNLPFDLSRLAMNYTYSKAFQNGFSLKLLEPPYYPDIVIQHRDSNSARIKFTKQSTKNKKKTNSYQGYFLDLKTSTFVLTDRSMSLAEALKAFNATIPKTETEDLGKITPNSLAYNENDVRATHELYQKEMERYKLYGLKKEPNQLYSPAGIGKAYLEKRGVKPFMEKNPDFPKELLGKAMNTFYAGRSEVRIRKQPIQVTYLDFTSMYPSVYTLLGMEAFLKADKIGYHERTKETQELLNTIKQEDVRDKGLWEKLTVICRLKPDNDILPVRSNYGNKNTKNIGLNYLTSNDISVYYTLPDLIASKFLTGKTPIIEEAIEFYPIGIQEGLREIEILPGIPLKPDEEFIKKLIEERIRLKALRNTKIGIERDLLDILQNILKIIANSTAYGIFIELNSKKVKKQTVDVYGLSTFQEETEKIEAIGRYFNPIMAVFITACSRLILATAEALLEQNGGYLAYCDTDSVFVSPQHVGMIQEFFKPLNPYKVDTKMFKIEEDDDEKERKPLENVWFYGISAKRYVLYDTPKANEIRIRKYSLHGLGHIQGIRNKQKQVWEDILKIHYNPEQKEAILEKYEGLYSTSQLTISNYDIFNRFSLLNKDKNGNFKPLNKLIKPFNFITVGIGYKNDTETDKPIIPMMPYISPKDKRFEQIPFMPFIDYRTGKLYAENTEFYWKPLPEIIESYIKHPESKFDGDVGRLKRKHIIIDKNSIQHIGKESNELEESEVLGVKEDNYTMYNNVESVNNSLNDRILNMSEAEAQELGISRDVLYHAKSNIRKSGGIGRSRIKKLLINNSLGMNKTKKITDKNQLW